jgi:DNA-binding protein H-NS
MASDKTVDLEALAKAAAAATAAYEKAKEGQKAEVIARLIKDIQTFNITPQDLGLVAPQKKFTRKPAAPKYINPANARETWTGRGRAPKWIDPKKPLESYLIK